jgi:hypothetical protein
METQETSTQTGSRLLFSRYKNGTDRSWSLRWKPAAGGRPVTLCRSQKDAPVVTHDVMEELFEDQRVEAILADIMRRRGEP